MQANIELIKGYCADWSGNCDHTTVARFDEQTLSVKQNSDTPYAIIMVDLSDGVLDAYASLAKQIRSVCGESTPALMAILPTGYTGLTATLNEKGFSACQTRPLKYSKFFHHLSAFSQPMGAPQNTDNNGVSSNTNTSNIRHSIKALIVDDNPINRKLLSKILDKIAVQNVLAEDGSQAFEACQQQAFNIIFMDCQMPKLDGYEATKLIRQGEKNQNTIIVGITANTTDENRQACVASGMNGFIGKPFNKAQIIDCILEQGFPLSTDQQHQQHQQR
jgi:CheY-like chemotaxis protein